MERRLRRLLFRCCTTSTLSPHTRVPRLHGSGSSSLLLARRCSRLTLPVPMRWVPGLGRCIEQVSILLLWMVLMSFDMLTKMVGHPLHKYYNYTVIHISELLNRRDVELADLLTPPGGQAAQNQVLVVDCITNFSSVPTSPVADRSDSPGSSPIERKGSFSAAAKMHFESRKRQFGSDMEILIRALCSQRGWNAIISRRKRGCLACAIREAGALGWKLIIRVP